MKILVTGAKGFVGRNLVSQLRNIAEGKARWYPVDKDITVYEYDMDSTPEELDAFCADCDFVFNLAGVNRPQDPEEFMKVPSVSGASNKTLPCLSISTIVSS